MEIIQIYLKKQFSGYVVRSVEGLHFVLQAIL